MVLEHQRALLTCIKMNAFKNQYTQTENANRKVQNPCIKKEDNLKND